MRTEYGVEKSTVIEKLRNISSKLERMESDHNLSFPELNKKIRRAVEAVCAERFSIALFGAFSDGKSTVLSSATGRTDIAIAPTPTTDAITLD